MKTAIIEVNQSSLEGLIGGIHDLSDSLILPAFTYTAGYWQEHPDELDDWLCEQYSVIAASNRIIAAAAELLDIALINGDINITAGDRLGYRKP